MLGGGGFESIEIIDNGFRTQNQLNFEALLDLYFSDSKNFLSYYSNIKEPYKSLINKYYSGGTVRRNKDKHYDLEDYRKFDYLIRYNMSGNIANDFADWFGTLNRTTNNMNTIVNGDSYSYGGRQIKNILKTNQNPIKSINWNKSWNPNNSWEPYSDPTGYSYFEWTDSFYV